MYKHTHYLLCFLLLTPHAYALEGKVVGVTDGDTLAILDVTKSQHRIRLAEIDAGKQTSFRAAGQASTLQALFWKTRRGSQHQRRSLPARRGHCLLRRFECQQRACATGHGLGVRAVRQQVLPAFCLGNNGSNQKTRPLGRSSCNAPLGMASRRTRRYRAPDREPGAN